MAPKKKKTKAPTNPGRGFATTSMPSKARPDEGGHTAVPKAEVKNENSKLTEKGAAVDQTDKREGTQDASADLHQSSPEELEQQLEDSELQLLVEKYALKTRQASSRAVSKLVTDKRVLRGQATLLSTRAWLPDELIDDALKIIQGEEHDVQDCSRWQIRSSQLGEEDFMVKLWSLRETLLQAGFYPDNVEHTLKFLAHNPSAIDPNTQTWGLKEALERLAIDCDAEALPLYSQDRAKSRDVSRASSRPDTPSLPIETQNAFFATSNPLPPSQLAGSGPAASNPSPSVEIDDSSSAAESDLNSDLEPDQLLPTYITAKSRLFQRRPDLLAASTSGKKSQSTTFMDARPSKPLTPGIKKLQQKLQQIESDVLFDQRQVDEVWKTTQINLLREAAEGRKRHTAETIRDKRNDTPLSQETSVGSTSPFRNEVVEQSSSSVSEIMDEAEMLGGLFAALPNDIDAGLDTKVREEQPDSTITIRNFGNPSGMSPKRILEEACRARDSSVKLSFKHVSQTTYSSRHALSIAWTRDPEIPDASLVPAVQCVSDPRRTIFTMISVATPELVQSESYIATAALFILFSGSTKEEKAHLRLPPVWRDLWTEFATAKQERSDAMDRETLRGLRNVLRDQPERDQDEDVILTSSFKRRAQHLDNGINSPSLEQDIKLASTELQEVWRRKSSTPSYQRMLLSRSKLPIANFRDDALAIIERNQVTIICGETGCGKSTQIPAYVLEHQLSRGKDCKIYCTQPRRISAISLAQRVSEELGEDKDDCGTVRSLVGYAIRLESQTTARTRLVYATVGIVLRMFESTQGIEGTTHLVIDEVHERSIDTDFLLILLRSLMVKRPDLKVILMSATVDADRFSRYLNNAPTLTVPGRTFPVHTKFLEDAIEATAYRPSDATQDIIEDDGDGIEEDSSATNRSGDAQKLQGYSQSTINVLRNFDEYRVDYDLIIALLEKIAYDPSYAKYSKVILVFLPGINEIRKLNDILSSHPRFLRDWFIYPLHSTISSEEQQRAFLIPPQGTRKIVLSTNITETSVTIPDIVCVIDTAKHKEMRYDERRQLSRLIQAFISRANAKQRRGRAGRVQEGLCFHLITRNRHDNMIAPQQTPEMLRLSLQELCMRVKICKMGDIEHALSDALDPPSSKNIRRAIDALVEVNALTPAEELTDLGKQLAKLPLDAHLGKLVLTACTFGCLDFALTTAAMLSSKSPFVTPIGQRQRADTVRLGFKKGDSDLLTAYNAYCAWRRVCQDGASDWQFCRKNFLSPQNLASIEDLKAQLLGALLDANYVVLDSNDAHAAWNHVRSSARHRNFVPQPVNCNTNNDNEVIVSSLVAWSFYPKLLVRDGKGWRSVANNQSVSLHPTSVNKVSSASIKFLSFYHIMQSSTRFTNAHETSPCPDISLVLLAGDADFKLYAGVIVIDGNRLRFMVDDWKAMIVLKRIRERMKEAANRKMKKPGAALPEKLKRWLEIWRRVMDMEGRRTV